MARLPRAEHVLPVIAVVTALLVVADLPGSAGAGWGGAGAMLGPGGGAGPAARPLAVGLLAAPAVMGYAHRWAAAWAAVLCAAVWATLGLGYGWRDLLPCGYAVAAVLVARHRPAGDPVALLDHRPVGGALTAAVRRHAGPVELHHAAGAGIHVVVEVPERVPPAPPDGRPAIGRRTAALGMAALGVATALAAWRGGSEVALAAAVVAAGLGIALLARVRDRRRGLRALFAAAQPVRDARVVDQLGYLHVLVPAADGRTALEFGVDTADSCSTSDPEDGEPLTRPARLYGDPRPGGWVAVEVDGRVHVPIEPVGDTAVVAYDPDRGVPREVSDDEEQLTDPDALTGADRDAAPGLVREHRIAPARAWATTVVIGLGAALAAAELADLAGRSGTWPAVAVIAAVAAAGYEFGWRTRLRPRLRWHAGGVAAVGARRRIREPWTVDSAVVHDDENAVTLVAGGSVLTVAAPQPLPGFRQRSADQLVAALRAARTRAFDGGDLPPPLVEVPRRPLILLAAWAATVAGAAALFAR